MFLLLFLYIVLHGACVHRFDRSEVSCKTPQNCARTHIVAMLAQNSHAQRWKEVKKEEKNDPLGHFVIEFSQTFWK